MYTPEIFLVTEAKDKVPLSTLKGVKVNSKRIKEGEKGWGKIMEVVERNIKGTAATGNANYKELG